MKPLRLWSPRAIVLLWLIGIVAQSVYGNAQLAATRAIMSRSRSALTRYSFAAERYDIARAREDSARALLARPHDGDTVRGIVFASGNLRSTPRAPSWTSRWIALPFFSMISSLVLAIVPATLLLITAYWAGARSQEMRAADDT